MLDRADDSAHDRLHLAGDTAAHPIQQPSTMPAALRILTMAQALAAVRALPAWPMTARSGAPNRRIQVQAAVSCQQSAPCPAPAHIDP